MSARPSITLQEWASEELAGVRLTPADGKLAEALSKRVRLDELRTGLRIRARSWVGVVQFESFTLTITPKLAGDHLGLVEMLAYTSGIEALRRHEGLRRLDAAKDASLLDLLALLFAERCTRIVKQGLLHDYRTDEDTLQVVRGRLLVAAQVLRHFGRVDRLACRFDERSADVVENQILGAALAALRHRVQHAGVRQQILGLHDLFSGLCDLGSLDGYAARRTLAYHRLNARYQDAHELAWLILDGLAVEDLLSPGPVKSFSFLLDMNQLFERFTEKLIRQLFASLPLRIQAQRRERSVLWDVTRNRSYARVIPDLLLEHSRQPGCRLVIDAKYKRYDDRRLSSADVYQTFLYAYAFQGDAPALPRALLLYPASGPAVRQTRLHVRQRGGTPGAEIQAVGLPIRVVIDELHGRKKPELCHRLREVMLTALTASRMD